jgi:hypothetical protein
MKIHFTIRLAGLPNSPRKKNVRTRALHRKLGKTLKHYTHEDAKRSISKIVLEYIKYKKNNLPIAFTKQCIEACFDWLIHDDKVATKAYAMRALWSLRQKHDWILPELKDIITKDFSFHSAGYKAAAKDVLRNLQKLAPKD